MPEKRLDEGADIQEVRAPIVSTALTQRKLPKSNLERIAETLNIIEPNVKSIAKQKIQDKAEAQAVEADNISKDILAMPSVMDADGNEDRLASMKAWRDATETNPQLIALNPYAQAKARRNVARHSARGFESEISDMVNELGSDISAEDDLINFTNRIHELRRAKLDALEITDPSEIATFNSEFAQMEQNFRAQFTAKVAQVKEETAMTSLGDQVMTSFEALDTMPVETAVATIGAQITRDAASHEVNGLLRKSKRTAVVADMVQQSLVKNYEATGHGRDFVEAGGLGHIQFNMENEKPTDLENYQNKQYKEKLLAEFDAIDDNKKAARALTMKAERETIMLTLTNSLAEANRDNERASTEEAWHGTINSLRNDPVLRAKLGDEAIEVLENKRNALRVSYDANAKGTFAAGSVGPEFEELRLESNDPEVSVFDTLRKAEAAGSRLTPSELRYFQDEEASHKMDLDNDVLEPMTKGVVDMIKTAIAGGNPTSETDLQKFQDKQLKGTIDRTTTKFQALMSIHNQFISNKARILKEGASDVEIFQAMGDVRNMALDRLSALYGVDHMALKAEQEKTIRTDEKVIKIREDIQSGGDFPKAKVLKGLTPDQQDELRMEYVSPESVLSRNPNMHFENVATLSDTYQDVVSDPRTKGIYTKQDWAIWENITRAESDYKKAFSKLGKDEGQAHFTQAELEFEAASGMVKQLDSVMSSIDNLSNVAPATTAAEFAELLTPMSTVGISNAKRLGDFNKIQVGAEYGSTLIGNTLKVAADELRELGRTEEADDITLAASSLGHLTRLLRDTKDAPTVAIGRQGRKGVAFNANSDLGRLIKKYSNEDLPWLKYRYDTNGWQIGTSLADRAAATQWAYGKAINSGKKYYSEIRDSKREEANKHADDQQTRSNDAFDTVRKPIANTFGDAE